MRLDELLATRATLADTGVDKLQTGSIHVARDVSDATYHGFLGMDASTPEHTMLAALYEKHAGNLALLAELAPSSYCLSLGKMQRRPPVSAKQFAFRCVEGDYVDAPGGEVPVFSSAPVSTRLYTW